jgi:hypothetical protein
MLKPGELYSITGEVLEAKRKEKCEYNLSVFVRPETYSLEHINEIRDFLTFMRLADQDHVGRLQKIMIPSYGAKIGRQIEDRLMDNPEEEIQLLIESPGMTLCWNIQDGTCNDATTRLLKDSISAIGPVRESSRYLSKLYDVLEGTLSRA